ncbi:hypothetical protein [Oscillatoria sp. FACHB-1406]|uniref:hypothetical protein n=1 Tax=Oscillatoria sp. FACHB-1406 TaxID=2692846 RepID=UPI0016886785|nr:hypothetical protein [Oscillatoria sp. FACHB-1406]MBD2578646.1 hypothetical protein [Oscillatoria sp. FACHB-1406]
MARTLTLVLPDHLEQALTERAECLNQSMEEVMLQLLSQQLTISSQSESEQPGETDPLLRLIGSLNVDVSDLAENHDYYIGQALRQKLKRNE